MGNGTPVGGGEEERAGFSGIFEIAAPDKAGAGRAKKETHLRGTPIAAPIAPFATLAAQSTLAIPTAQGREGARARCSTYCAGQLTSPTSPRVPSALDAGDIEEARVDCGHRRGRAASAPPAPSPKSDHLQFVATLPASGLP